MPDLPPVVCVVPLLSKKCQSGIIVPVKNRFGPTAQTQGRGRRDLEMIRANAQTRRKGDRIWETSVYKGYKQDKIEMRGDRAEMSDFPLYLNTVAGGLDRRDQTIGGFSFVVKIYAVPVVEIIG